MTFVVQLLRFVNLFTAAIIAGSQVMVSLVILPAMRRWSPSLSLQTHQNMLDTQPDRFIVPSAIICPIAAILILIVRHKLRSMATFFYIVGIVFTGVVTIASVAFAEPTSVKMREWQTEAVPNEYADVRSRWDRIHTIRSVSSLIALASYIIAALSD